MNSTDSDKWISEIVGVFCDPIIVWPGPWLDTLPDWVKPSITIDRLLECAMSNKEGHPTATDSEALAYMYPRSMESPMGHDWTEIYLYLGTRVCRQHRKVEFPEDIAKETLTDGQMRDLRDLKNFIYDRRLRVRTGRLQGEKREAKKEAEELRKETIGEQMFMPMAVK